MITLFQKLASQLPQTFHKEPPKKLLHQDPPKWSPRTKTALAALTTFSTLAASYLAYRYSFPKINIPDSTTSSPIRTAFNFVGFLGCLAGGVRLMTYTSTNQTNIPQEQKSNTEPNDDIHSKIPIPKALNSEEEAALITPESTESETIIEDPNTKKTSDTLDNDKQKSTHSDIEKLFVDFHAGEKINKALLEELITKCNDPNMTSSEVTFSNKIFSILLDYQYGEKTDLNKIIDILDVFTGRIDRLSCRVVEGLFSDIIPNYLHKMTQKFINLEDTESKGLAGRSCQLVYQALAQQMMILFSDDIDLGTKNTADKTFKRIFELLTPFEKDDFRLSPDFYANFIQFSPHPAWRFVQEYIFEYMINKELPFNMYVPPDKLIAKILNERDEDKNVEEVPRYTSEDGFYILKKILDDAKCSLFSDDQDQGAASFAIRFMQRILDPYQFEKNYPNDHKLLEQFYYDLCSLKDLEFYINFTNKNDLSKQTASIANELINYYEATFFENDLLDCGLRHSFFKTIVPLSGKKEYSDDEKRTIRYLSCYITDQILNPSKPHQAKLASLALNKYSKVFQNEESVNLIKEAYQKAQPLKNADLDTDLHIACQKFIENWDDLNKVESEIKKVGPEDPGLTVFLGKLAIGSIKTLQNAAQNIVDNFK